MIVVNATSNEILIEGHANYAEEGKDIVCSAVSTLALNLINSLLELTDSQIEYEAQDGKIKVKFKHLDSNGDLLISAFILGIKSISNEYPQCVMTKS